jgi:uncharacterized protein
MAPQAKSSLPALLLLASMACSAPAALAQDNDREPEKRTISLGVTGSVKATPDKVDISTGVTSQAKSARAALDQNTDAMTKIVAELKAAGIEAKDIQTTNFSVTPVYNQQAEANVPPTIIGYQVTNQVRITVHDTAKLGAILDKVVSLGANQIDTIEFGIDDPKALKDAARKQAIEEATANAKLYAEAAGVELGPIQTIAEEEYSYIPRYTAGAAAMEAKSVPIEAGTATVEVKVHVVWEIK